jgi:hypothetical protein
MRSQIESTEERDSSGNSSDLYSEVFGSILGQDPNTSDWGC